MIRILWPLARRASILALFVWAASAVAAGAQRSPETPPTPADRIATTPDQFNDWRETRSHLQEILRQYPPSVGQVLRLDPSLTRGDYLAAYPSLAAFVAQHPEIPRNPSYFFGTMTYEDPPSARVQVLRTFGDFLAGFAAFLFGLTLLGVITWIVRSSFDHRRWVRATKVQTDAHLKLVDRLTSNEELLAYIQTAAGRQFLEAPQSPSGALHGVSAPVGRILWSVQAGVILVVVGAGLWLVRNTLIEELAGPLSAMAVLAIALGAGFAVSALVAYVISQHLGLFEPQKPVTDRP